MQEAVAHSIQLAVAPVFMLTAIAAMISALANRLSRIIDRGRILEDKLIPSDPADMPDTAHQAHIHDEMQALRRRGRVVNAAMTLLILAAALIGATVLELFLVETTSMKTSSLIPWTFMSGVVSFVFALLCFLVETFLAGRSLNFGKRLRQ
jgi:Protein of unknown function (DUF2721)